MQSYKTISVPTISRRILIKFLYNLVFPFLLKTISYLANSQCLRQETPALIFFYQLLKKYINHLLMAERQEVFSLILLRRLKKYGTNVYYANYNVKEYQEMCYINERLANRYQWLDLSDEGFQQMLGFSRLR